MKYQKIYKAEKNLIFTFWNRDSLEKSQSVRALKKLEEKSFYESRDNNYVNHRSSMSMIRSTSTQKKTRRATINMTQIEPGEFGSNSYIKRKKTIYNTAMKNFRTKMKGLVNSLEEQQKQSQTSQRIHITLPKKY